MAWSKLRALFASIRVGETMILQGAPLLGIAFSIGPVTTQKLIAALIFSGASFLLVAHIFTLNDWADFSRGVHHSDGAISRLEEKNVRPPLLLFFSFVLLVASLLLFFFLSQDCLLLAAGVAALGIFYSHPSLNVKSIPIFSSLVHFLGGLLHFLLGYALFSAIDHRGIGIAIFFALIFTAGHLNQEIRDFEIDLETGARTNAVTFGKRANFITGLVLFAASYASLLFLAWNGFMPRPLAFLSVILFVIHCVLSMQTLHRGLTSERIRHFQTQYRLLYSVLGLAMVASLLWP